LKIIAKLKVKGLEMSFKGRLRGLEVGFKGALRWTSRSES